MKLLALLETLHRHLKGVILTGCAVLALVASADIVRIVTARPEAAGEAGEQTAGFWTEFYRASENWPLFWTAFGFAGCILIVVVSKGFGHFGVSKREDYYDV